MNYVWQRLPLLLLFANGYIIYRLFVLTRLTEWLVSFTLRRAHGKLTAILFYVTGTAALLSFFIPNTVTVLAMLPVLKAIDNGLREEVEGGAIATTAITLSVIYGANIGGMGSLIGSPANLLLLGALDYFEVQGREQITFFNWFLWSVPLVTVLVVAAWGIVAKLAVPRPARNARLRLPSLELDRRASPSQRVGGLLFSAFLLFWVSESIAVELFPAFKYNEPLVCLIYFILFFYLVFARRPHGETRPLLSPGDLVSGLPKRGILFLMLLGLLFGFVKIVGLDQMASGLFASLIPTDASSFVLFLFLTTVVIFLTEILSNSVVSIAFFVVAHSAAIAQGLPPLPLMMAVSIASTCAFMTPIATPCNALAFGEMKGTSLGQMLGLGFVLNVVGAVMMSAWLSYIIPLVYEQY